MPEVMTTPTQETNMETRQRKVTFHGRVKYRKISYLEQEEIPKAWYQPRDFMEARESERQLRSHISLDMEMYLKNEDGMCALGLRTESDKRARFAAIRASIQAALKMQASQRETTCLNFTDNDDTSTEQNAISIASVYYVYSSVSALEASRRGLRHERNVQSMDKEEIDMDGPPKPPSRVVSSGSIRKFKSAASPLQDSARMSCTSAAA